MTDIRGEVVAVVIEKLASKFGKWLYEKHIRRKLENGEGLEQDRKTDSKPG